ncbi:MAG: pilus assembly protein TadG-related protein [Phycisphaeraceae bacterium]
MNAASADLRCSASRERGVVLIVVIFALALIAGLVFFVLNTGRHVQRRVETQQAADATVEAAATRLARSFNTIAQNQVATARSLALVNVLDAAPNAVRFTLADQNAVLESTNDQLSRLGNSQWTEEALSNLVDEVQLEIAILDQVDAVLNGAFDVRTVTFYRPPTGGVGWLWQAMLSLDAVSRSVVETLPETVTRTALEAGERHLRNAQAEAFPVPLLRDYRIERGDFSDFERPVSEGLLPANVDDPIVRRGPWDAVFGYRDPIGGLMFVGGGSSSGGSGSGSVPIGSGAGSRAGGSWVRTEEPDFYRVLGPQQWMLHSLHHMTEQSLPHARFAGHVSELSNIKLEYFRSGVFTAELQTVDDPEWERDFTEATRIAAEDRSRIVETGFIAVELKSQYPRNHPRFLTPGTFDFVPFNYARGGGAWSNLDLDRSGGRLVVVNGWNDPRDWGVPKINNHTWRDEWTYTVEFDTDIGLQPETDEEGNTIPHTVHRIDEFIFLGVNIGEDIEVRNPHNWSVDDNLPAPYRFADGELPPDDPATIDIENAQARRELLTFFAVARQAGTSPFWSERFDARLPQGAPIAIAQADVFNNHSWDLWTPMWHARLQHVTGYEDWIDRFDQALPDVAAFDELDPAIVEAAHDHLEAAEPLAEELLAR